MPQGAATFGQGWREAGSELEAVVLKQGGKKVELLPNKMTRSSLSAVLVESPSNGKCRRISDSKQVFVSSLSCTGRLLHPSQDAVVEGHIAVGQS